MKVLLDTHILLWALADSPLLSATARDIVGAESNECFYSPVSLTEISIKHRLHPENMVLSATDARGAFMTAGFRELPFLSRHAAGMDLLPPHHSDPFDRMLIAQAETEGMKLVSHDDKVALYGATIIQV
jgi:PIN domain nuclease of toxin-antitoxin system